jgi:ABC-type transport system involved in multi-copper enzyme maturation permease subunit
MIRGVLVKSFWESNLPTLLFGIALFLVMAILTFVIPQLQKEIGQALAQLPFAKSFLAALLGIDVDQEMTAQVLQSVVWVHPAVLALVWAHEIVFCTRIPAAEIDRGTIDVLLGLPVSRRSLYVAETLMWLATGCVVLAMGSAGYFVSAQRILPELRPGLDRVLMVLANLFGVYVAVGGLAFLVSACNSRRGPAIALVFTLVLASFLLTFLARFWTPAQQLEFLSVLHYYQPAQVLRTGNLPVRDLAALGLAGALAWTAGCEVLARRNICTV